MIMGTEATLEEKNKSRLLLLIIARLIIITLFLGVAIFLDIRKDGFPFTVSTLNFLYFIIAATYFFSIAYILLLKIFKDLLTINIYLQLALDVILVTLLVYITGSFRSNYSVLYTLIIIYSVIFLGRYGGLIIASAAGIFYGLLLDFEFYNLIPPISSIEHDHQSDSGRCFYPDTGAHRFFLYIGFISHFCCRTGKKSQISVAGKRIGIQTTGLAFPQHCGIGRYRHNDHRFTGQNKDF